MKVMCCDNCKRDFESFNVEGIAEKIAWGFVVPEESQDPEYLMSDFSSSFLCFIDKETEREEGKLYWYVACIDNINDEI